MRRLAKHWRALQREFQLYWKVLGPYRPMMLPILVVMAVSAGLESISFSLVFPLLQVMREGDAVMGWKFHFLLSQIDVFSKREQVLIICLLMLALILIKNLFVLGRIFLTSQFVNSLRCYWRCGIMRWYLTANDKALASKRHGFLTNNLIRETDKAACSVRPLIEILAAGFFITGLFGTLLWFDWRSTVFIGTATCLVVWLISKYSLKSSREIGRQILRLDQYISSMASENIHALEEIKAFSIEDRRHKAFAAAVDEEKRVLRRSDLVAQLPNLITEVVFAVTFVLLVLFLVFFLRLPFSVVVSTLGVFVVLSQRILLLGSKIGSSRVFMLLGYPSVRLIHFFEEAKKAFEQKQGGRPIGALAGDIRFRRVSFSYPGHPVFRDLSFDIPKGKITAITGPSGVGKTTLINLLLGFFENYEGEVFINGEELREIDPFSLRRRVGLVGQEPLLFQGSIRENICLGKPDASLGEIVEAATIANAHLFIERFKAGYETDVAEGGLSLSVGEKQRIAIARAVILKPDLLIFDEPTSALDAESERLIAESIRRISRESTVILISHKPSTLVAADRVLKMEGGTLFEEARDTESSAPLGVALTSSVHP